MDTIKTVASLEFEIERLKAELVSQGAKLEEKFELSKLSMLKTEHEKIIERLKVGYDEKIKGLTEQLQLSIMLSEHEIIVEKLRDNYNKKLSKINKRQIKQHNERGAGRKKKVTDEIKTRILQLHSEGNSQFKIAKIVSDEFKIQISRTAVGEIVRNKNSISIREMFLKTK